MNYDKPGCYGNAITYNNKSKTCLACSEAQSCAVAARQRIEELRPLVSVDPIIRMAHSAPQKLSARLPESALNIIATMSSRQRKTVGVLMTLDTPTPPVLVEALMKKLKWDKTEAVQQAKETVSLLIKNDLASTEGGRILMRY